MMKSGIGESITKAQKEVGDCGTGAETPKDTRSGRTKCTRSHVTSQPKLQDKIPDLGNLWEGGSCPPIRLVLIWLTPAFRFPQYSV